MSTPPPDLAALTNFVGPTIIEAMDQGQGRLHPLPVVGTAEWHESSTRVKWAAVAVAAIEGYKLANRAPADAGDYWYTADTVAEQIAFAAEAYQTGYDAGRRDQKALVAKAASVIRRRLGADA